jgi:hypothetical protein
MKYISVVLALILIFGLTNVSAQETKILKEPKEVQYYNTKIAFNIGIGYLLADTPSDAPDWYDDYIDEMRMNLNFDLRFSHFFSPTGGLLLMYSNFSTSNNINLDGVRASDDISLNFFGIGYSSRQSDLSSRVNIYADIAIGLAKYENNGVIDGGSLKIDGSTFGLFGSLGLEIKLKENISFALEAGYLVANFTEMDVEFNGRKETLKSADGDSWSRFTLQGGIHFYF